MRPVEATSPTIDEIADLAQGKAGFQFVKLLHEFFSPVEIVLILRAAHKAKLLNHLSRKESDHAPRRH